MYVRIGLYRPFGNDENVFDIKKPYIYYIFYLFDSFQKNLLSNVVT